jgi:phage tail-like protein
MGNQNDPDVPYRYTLEIGGVSVARFTEVQGLSSKSSYESKREGGNNFYEYSAIMPNSFEPLTIKKGFYSAGSEFYSIVRALHVATKKIKRVDMQLVMLNDKYDEVGRFSIYKAFPYEYEGPSFNSTAKEIVFESIKIRYDFFEYHPGNAISGVLDAAVSALSNATGISF